MRPGTPLFRGARLREIREARQMTSIGLANALGVSQPAVSQYELGRQTPSPKILRKMTEVLNVPQHFFLRPTDPGPTGPLFFRSLSSATKSARTRARRRYAWLREIVDLLQLHVEFPAVNLPKLSIPIDPNDITNIQIDRAAEELRRFWGLRDGPISNVVTLLENNGIIVARQELAARTLDAFSEWRDVDSAPYVILGSDKAAAARSRFDAAHELAHLMLHRELREEVVNRTEFFRLIEDQAHRFAGAFLLPEESFAADVYIPTLDTFRLLKSKWKVSIGAMIVRSRHLGLINRKQESRLWINMARRKWKTVEPLDDTLEVEEPRFLRKCFDLLFDEGILSRSELEACLALRATDIEDVVGLPLEYLDSRALSPRLLRMPANLQRSPRSSSENGESVTYRFPQDGQGAGQD